MTRIVTVFGATGQQGSAVVKALLADGIYTPRAVTRNVTGEAAKKLKASGAEVAEGDLWDTASVEKAIAGSEGVFAVTNFWDPAIMNGNHEGEIQQGKRIIDASKKAGVKFLVWSSLEDADKVSNGRFKKIHHFNTKAKIDHYLRESGVPHAIIYTSWYAENTVSGGAIKKNAEGGLELAIPKYNPTSKQLITWVGSSIGPATAALFKHYEDRKAEVVGHSFVAANGRITYPEFAETLSKAIGKPITITYPPASGLEDLDEMFEYMSTTGMYADTSIPDPRLVQLGAKFGTLTEFAETVAKPHFQ